jgi:hypothetical protein
MHNSLIVSHREPGLTLHHREPGAAWKITEAKAAGVLMLACTGAELRVDDVYAGGLEDV